MENKKQPAGRTRIALYVVGLVVLALSFCAALLVWKFGDRELATTALDILKTIALIILAFYFGRSANGNSQ